MGASRGRFAVEGFSEVLNAEVSPLGIKVTIVEPGESRTRLTGSSMTLHPVSQDMSSGRPDEHLRRGPSAPRPATPSARPAS